MCPSRNVIYLLKTMHTKRGMTYKVFIALSNTDQIQDSMENIVNMEKKQQNYLKGMYRVNKNCIRMVGFFSFSYFL